MTRTLRDIEVDLKKLQNSHDTEVTHSEADDLLIEALYLASFDLRRNSYREQARRIIALYEAIEKWYA